MQRTQTWARQHEQSVQEEPEEEKNKKSSTIIQEIISDRISQEIVDDLASMKNKQNPSPLVFYGKIGSSYLFSFKRADTPSFITRFLCITVFIIGVQIFLQKVALVSQQIKKSLISFTVIQIVSSLLLYFLDPGTLFDDEVQMINEQRLYCQTCRVYRSHRSHHCTFCVKCVKGYDHHCGFFSKCIGRRNYLLFCLFLVSTTLCVIGTMGSFILTVFKEVTFKNSP